MCRTPDNADGAFDNQRRVDLVLGPIIEAASAGWRVLEVGAGLGRVRQVGRLREAGIVLYGCDPSTEIARNPYLVEYDMDPVELVVYPEMFFDAIYSLFVLEHVCEPRSFLSRIYSLLKPGAYYHFVTPNRLHYFSFLSRMSQRFGVQEQLLHLLRGQEAEYHVPTFYRLNDRATLLRYAQSVGFSECSIEFSEDPAEVECYLPRGLRWVPTAYCRCVDALGASGYKLNVVGHLRR